MKQKLRRFMAGFLAILTMFTTLFTNGTTAFAASSSANIAFWVASSKDHGVISEFNSKHTGSILYAMIDGHSAYCMNFGLSAKGGQLMNSDSNPNTNLSAAQEKLLAYCMYYGYSTTEAKAPTNDQRNKFIATQSMVWIIVNGIFGTGSADSAASKLCACAPDSSSSYSYYETLRDVIVKDKIRQAIKKINSEQNTTIVLTTHDMLDIESLADKIIMIDKGKLAFQGSIEKLRSMYGEGKIITFKLTDVSDFSKLIQSIETSGIEAKITREDRQVSILFDASKNSISSFIINLLQSVNVNDIMLSDIGIDEIVKKAYSREV